MSLHSAYIPSRQHQEWLTGWRLVHLSKQLVCLFVCRKLRLQKVGVTNGVLRGISDLVTLEEVVLPDSHRVTDVGLSFFSCLTNIRLDLQHAASAMLLSFRLIVGAFALQLQLRLKCHIAD